MHWFRAVKIECNPELLLLSLLSLRHALVVLQYFVVDTVLRPVDVIVTKESLFMSSKIRTTKNHTFAVSSAPEKQ